MLHSLNSIIGKTTQKIYAFNRYPDEIRNICIYRYVSSVFTCIFYLIWEKEALFIFKIGVVTSILLVARIISEMYIKNINSLSTLQLLVVVETIGITLLLFPTGGIESPFIWYALNPVLVAGSFLPIYFCWINLLFYLVSTLVIPLLYQQPNSNAVKAIFHNNIYKILVLILITIAVQLLEGLIKRLRVQAYVLEKERKELVYTNNLLKVANSKAEQSVNQIMSLYQIVEAFTSQDKLENFIRAIANYGAILSKAELSFFWMAPTKEQNALFAANDNAVLPEELINEINKYCLKIKAQRNLISATINNMELLITTVKTSSKMYGVIGVEISKSDFIELEKNYEQQLNFLAELSGIILERFHLEDIANTLILTEEQNRIANEMHDSVSQKLFSIVCATHGLKSKWTELTDYKIQEQLNLINSSANYVMKEMRSVIYGLSTRKKGEKIFIISINKYLDEFSKLNNIYVALDISGHEDLISSQLKKTLYRVICEASGNAARHGRCTSLKVVLEINTNGISLIISDNGEGFDIKKIYSESAGLGIINMRKLIESFNGKFMVQSNTGEGTEIYITIPNENLMAKKGDVAL